MEVVNREKVASVALIHAKLSEDELAVYEAVLDYVLETMSAEEIERRFGALADEIEGMRDDLREAQAGGNRHAGDLTPTAKLA